MLKPLIYIWLHCERVAAYTKHNSILFRSIPLIPAHPVPFHSTLFLLFFSILFSPLKNAGLGTNEQLRGGRLHATVTILHRQKISEQFL